MAPSTLECFHVFFFGRSSALATLVLVFVSLTLAALLTTLALLGVRSIHDAS